MNSGTTFSLLQNLTGSAPTLATEGQPLKGLSAVTPMVEVTTPATQTLAGAGTLQCWLWDPMTETPAGGLTTGSWTRCPSLDMAVSTSGVPRQAWEALQVIGPRQARVLWVPNGVTVSAGTQVRVYQLGYSPTETY